MRLTDDTLDAVKSATDIVEVVSDYVRLKKQGARFVGLCPFHNEKSPSFSVDPARGLYHCFGCKAGGDAIRFIQEIERPISFVDAVRMLAKRAGIAVPDEDTRSENDPREAIYHALRFAGRFFYTQLTRTEAGKARGLAYLQGRGFTPETIKRFGLGYAPDSWDALLRAAEEAQIKPDVLEAAGLVLPRKSGDGHYDRFRDRVIFPIQSASGKVLGFGGRILDKNSEQPKYINSPETAVYHKSQVLYGIYHARHAMRGAEEAVLVEGYTDVIALHQAGVEPVVAASGTALTEEQVALLGRYAKRLVLLFDADAAGLAAARRSIDLVLRAGLAAYVVALPDRADPDSFVQQFGGEAFTRYLAEERRSFATFLIEQAQRRGQLKTPEGQMEVARDVLSAIAQIPSDPAHMVLREGYVREAAALLGIPDVHLRRQFPDLVREAEQDAQRTAERPPPRDEPDAQPAPETPRVRPEEVELLRLMLSEGTPLVEFVLGHMGEQEFTDGPMREAIRALLAQYEAGAVSAEPLLSGRHGEVVQRLAAASLAERHAPSAVGERKHGISARRDAPIEQAASAMTLLKLDRVEEAIRQAQRQVYAAEQHGEDASPHLETVIRLQALRRSVEQRAFLDA